VSEASKFVANRLRQLRKQTALSQEQTADLVDVTFKYYQRLESGIVLGMRLSTLERIAKAYGIDLAAFFSKRRPKIRQLSGLPPPHGKKKLQLR
jgi:transcriptional regulator with XRE-family HTH domain